MQLPSSLKLQPLIILILDLSSSLLSSFASSTASWCIKEPSHFQWMMNGVMVNTHSQQWLVDTHSTKEWNWVVSTHHFKWWTSWVLLAAAVATAAPDQHSQHP